MFCPKCGNEVPDLAVACPLCGNSLAGVKVGTAGGFFTELFSGNLFFAYAILKSITVGSGLVSGRLDILGILIVIASWLLYAAAKKGNVAGYRSPLGIFYGVVVTKQVLVWISVGLIAFLGALCLLVSGFTDALIRELPELNLQIGNVEGYLRSIGAVFCGILLFVVAGLLCVVAIFQLGSFKKTLKSFRTSLATNTLSVVLSPAKIWCLLEGIISAIGLTNGLSDLASVGAGAASYIVLYALLKKAEQNLVEP